VKGGAAKLSVQPRAAVTKGAGKSAGKGKGAGRIQAQPVKVVGKSAGKGRAPVMKQQVVKTVTTRPANGKANGKGKGKGKGKGAGAGKKPAGKVLKSVKKGATKRVAGAARPGLHDSGVEVDEGERYSGECVHFDKRRGFGFIQPDVEGLVPDGKVMVHWAEITSSDKWPSLQKGQAVEFNLKKLVVKSGSAALIRAAGVTLAGGEAVALDGELEEKREPVGNREDRFSGTIKFYDTKKGFGYVALDVPLADVAEAKVSREEVLGGEAIPLAQGMAIEFGLYRNKKGNVCTSDVTMPGGETISRDVAEGRQYLGNKRYTGSVQWFSVKNGIGFIIPDHFNSLPKVAQQKSTEAAQRVADKSQQEVFEGLMFHRRDKTDAAARLGEGSKVSFNVFVDNRNAGATNVTEG